MASTLHEDIGAFLDDLATDLTNLHVASIALPDDPAKIPAGLIERAQQLRARLDDEGDSDEQPKAKKPAATKR